MGVLSNVKKQQYLKLLDKLAKSKAPLKEIEDAYVAYKKFCYDNGLKDDAKLNMIGERLIIEAEPDHTYIDDGKVGQAVLNLTEAIKNGEGISLDEATLILRWIVENTYHAIFESTSTNSISTLHSCDSFAQSLSALPFIDAGIPITINDTERFDPNMIHSFITVKIPVQTENGVETKQFLIDITYAAYFMIFNATQASFYDNRPGFKDTTGPAAGFYICQTEEGREFATELLSKGFIELTPERARLYCTAFECEKLNITNWRTWKKIMQSQKDYISIINGGNGELTYKPDNIEIFDMKIKFPEPSKRKKHEQ